MKIAVVGSRHLSVSEDMLKKYLSEAKEIVSGGARGIDTCAADYARRNGIALIEFRPKYELYGRSAPITRNKEIVNYADRIIVFWDGFSKGTRSVIRLAKKAKKNCEVVLLPTDDLITLKG